MSTDLVLTVLASDRPGLVRALADVVSRHGGNWVDSSMARLGGEFAGIVRVSLPQDEVALFEAALGALSGEGISVTARRTHHAGPHGATPARLEVTCADHPGIVREVSAALAGLQVSIETLETRVYAASMSGDPMFEAKARVYLPRDVSPDRLREACEAIATDLMAEITITTDP